MYPILADPFTHTWCEKESQGSRGIDDVRVEKERLLPLPLDPYALWINGRVVRADSSSVLIF